MSAARAGSLAVVIAFVLAAETSANARRDALEMSIEALADDAGVAASCAASARLVSSAEVKWWVTFGEVQPDSKGSWKVTGSGIRCGASSPENAQSANPTPYLVAVVSTTATIIPKGLLVLEVRLSRQTLSGLSAEGSPLYEQSSERRQFLLEERDEAFIPLLVPGVRDRGEFAHDEVLLRFAVKHVEQPRTSYGVIRVISGASGAELLLDGGVVGKLTDAGTTTLRNVRVGERRLTAREASGREARELVRVEKNRTVVVALDAGSSKARKQSFRLVSIGKGPTGHDEFRRERDGAVVVRIPAGEFLMGNLRTERAPLEHRVHVSGYSIDKTAVTWEQYEKFAAATGTPLPPDEPFWGVRDEHPAVFVTWEEAKAYCEWVGGRLPTEAEREKACRGADDRMYPWGNEEPDPTRAVYRREWGFAGTDPVGSRPKGASPYGLLDMGGNVWEWTADWYDEKYYEVSPSRDPRGPTAGRARVVRGGSWDSRPSVLSCSCRSWGYRGYREADFGFRCAMDEPFPRRD